ncbi:hypothetical protein PQQ65_32225 [Paraburkholderia strydomiana]|uniref:hypothetical protein n=1 Tax=Paraburkholderia strydomiana TaxID=1245417 RepID=UPI0038B85C93
MDLVPLAAGAGQYNLSTRIGTALKPPDPLERFPRGETPQLISKRFVDVVDIHLLPVVVRYTAA